jgi:hypothetical protein
MKKSILAGLIFGLLFVSMIGFASAQTEITDSLNRAVTGVVDVLRPIFEVIAGNFGDSTSVLVFKLLLMVLLLAITYSVLSMIDLFNSKPWVLWVVSIVISILGIRFLGPDAVTTILLPHAAFGVAVTAGLPFVIFSLFVEKGLKAPEHPAILRRTAWIFFAVVFIGLWIYNHDRVPSLAWIYIVAVVLAFVMALMDGTIQKFFLQARAEKALVGSKSDLLMHYKRQLKQNDEDLKNDLITIEEHRAKTTEITRRLKSLT